MIYGKRAVQWAIVAVVLITGARMAEAWWSRGIFRLSTHERITRDSIQEINEGEYPDLYRFVNNLKDGSHDEDRFGVPPHNPPGDGRDYVEWGGDSDAWFKHGTLISYMAYGFPDAYKQLGYAIHLKQDEQVPAHETVCYHGGITRQDELEAYASRHHGYAGGDTLRVFTDKKGYEWYYWLSDGNG